MTPGTADKKTGLALLDNLRVLVISGSDRVEFLQGQLTQDVTTLESAGTTLAGWASAKGRLLAVGQLITADDEIWWPLSADIVEGVAKRLQMFVLRADVKIVVSTIRVAGLFGIDGRNQLQIADETVPLDLHPASLADGSIVVRVSGDSDRAWLLGPAAETTGFDTSDASAWKLQSIRCGLPCIVSETQEQFVPQMLNLDLIGAISFTKGCYVGQEIVARTQNLGRIKRRMYRFGSDETMRLKPGATIYGPESATGKVVMTAMNDDGAELTAVIPIDQSKSEWFADEDRTIKLELIPLPYSMPDQ